ncbi:alpha/beta fold hydrolase [Streptomyces sp. TRM43335]|uniref:Alpha/beta fold hydrolase n=1 Tax=Streptomyces taklimakanensis TaxID=2569853 RepID=A0A6G2BF17_9ACTN|nr:alpha/beta hydrolase [Streptomyces taklimakanensis]MTE20877.1 alpha/beta fold hydrolase [Streptomyces taklimakanensis]
MSKPPFLTLPPGARAYRLATSRGDFAVHDAGEPRAGTALLVPGFTGSKEDFIALLAPLARRGFRVVAVDGRGQHETGGPRDEAAYAQEELARDLLAQAAALGGRIHLVGHSMGGLVARAAVLEDASPFASLTIMSSGPAAIAPAQHVRTRRLIEALAVLDMETVWRAMRELDPPEADDEGTPPAVREFLHRRWLANVPEQVVVTGRRLLIEPDRVDALAAVPLPKHVLSGEVDYAWPVPLMDEMARRLEARRTVVEGAEHSPGAERPEETAAAMAAFWHDCPGRAAGTAPGTPANRPG